MPSFTVRVIIENKSGLVDPEGDTILHDLILKDKETSVKRIRTAKMLKFEVASKNKASAEKMVKDLCNEYRIYNPIVSKLSVDAIDD